MKTGVKVLIRSEVRDARTDRVLRSRKARSNLVFDTALTSLATGALNFASFFASCKIGSSAAVNSTPGNTTTFTQSGTTITASASFFTAGMVGALFKYGTGTGGAEQYIATVAGGGLSCTVVGAGMTVGTPTAGTVWYVAQTALTTPLTALTGGGCVSYNYVTSPGSCGTSFPGGVNSTQITLQRTYKYPVQSTSYSVSEIGYSGNTNNDGTCNGRLVLGSPDTIINTEYYVVQIVITFTVSPNTPTALTNVGTGINTAGNMNFQYWDCYTVATSGAQANYQTSYGSNQSIMDAGPPELALFTSGAYSLAANIAQAQIPGFAGVTYASAQGSAWTNTSLGVGVAQTTISFIFSTAGETLYAVIIGGGLGTNISPIFALVLTTPITLPSGTFQGNLVYQRQITRTLSN